MISFLGLAAFLGFLLGLMVALAAYNYFNFSE